MAAGAARCSASKTSTAKTYIYCFTFVRLAGLIVLGRCPDSEPDRGVYGWAGRAAVLALALGCLATAATTPLEIRVIAARLPPVVPGSLTAAR
jgi:hypothetical protein